MKKNNLKVAVLCGGPSLERGISLNSARSVCDHLYSEEIEIVPIYFDHHKKAYLISRAQLYSNTPSDFDFKLHSHAKPLTETTLHKLLKSVDIAFPAMHGAFGEDGEIQKILEKHKIPYVGSEKEACRNCFDKYYANEMIKKHGFFTMPSMALKSHESAKHEAQIKDFFKQHKIKRAVIKPATGGSSIGVHSVNTIQEAKEAAKSIFSKKIDTRAVLEPFCEGVEFTVIILQNQYGMPVALFPTEMEMDYGKNQIFDFRRKYLASNQIKYHCPPRFSQEVTEKIQTQAEQLFAVLGMRDFARFDGWLMPDGELWFSDFNPISGMEQNSFLFLQGAQIGFSHSDLLHFILRNACNRHGINFPEKAKQIAKKRKKISVIFGGKTSERQVSVMSGTNVWLKLRKSQKYEAYPYLLDPDNEHVWRLPYSKTLNHTVEEILENCMAAKEDEQRISSLRRRVLDKIAAEPGHLNEELFIPEKIPLQKFIKDAEFVFIGLHGGIGENGEIQAMLEKAKTPFNGSGSKASQLCMDKYNTGIALKNMEDQGIFVPRKVLVETERLVKMSEPQLNTIWKALKEDISGYAVIVKPKDDGCSTGIVKLETFQDFFNYIQAIKNRLRFISPGVFKSQGGLIEMPSERPNELMFEQFIRTDSVRVVKSELKWKKVTGWIEVTIGLLGKGSSIKALSPSLTVASGSILSLEEKFQGGTGVNITPPPQPYVSKRAIKNAKASMEIVAKKLGISGYARIDAFMETDTGNIMIIEANSTPGLTGSTVIFHQALAEERALYPLEFLERIIENA